MPRIERYITKSLNFPNKQDPSENIRSWAPKTPSESQFFRFGLTNLLITHITTYLISFYQIQPILYIKYLLNIIIVEEACRTISEKMPKSFIRCD